MVLTDVITLIKKIAIGIIVTLIPFLILFGGLRLTQKILTKEPVQEVKLKDSNP